MRKALGLVFLGCALVVGLACSEGATTPTETAVTATSDVQSVSAAVQPSKDLICHRNESDPYGVVTEVSAKTIKRHYKHLYETYQDCIWLQGTYCGNSGEVCDPSNSYYSGGRYICNANC